jgi:hypothetical protein
MKNKITHWTGKYHFYLSAGIVLMIPVLLIARTAMFYLCYLPIIFGAIWTSGSVMRSLKVSLPSKWIRCFSFIGGMVIAELIFSLVLVASGELSFQPEAHKNDWLILSIELLLGIAVFELFFLMALAIRYLFCRNQ